VKRINLADLTGQAHTDPQVINLEAGDELVWVDRSAGGGEVLLMTASGQAIRFAEDDVRAMGLPAGSIGGIRLQARDRVVGGLVIPAGTRPDSYIVSVTDKGWGKRTPLSDFPTQGRNGQGVVAAKPSPKSGVVAGVALLVSDEAVVCLSGPAESRILAGDALPAVGRSALGRPLFAPPAGRPVVGVVAVPGLTPAPPAAQAPSRATTPKPTPARSSGAAPKAKVPPASAKAAPSRPAQSATQVGETPSGQKTTVRRAAAAVAVAAAAGEKVKTTPSPKGRSSATKPDAKPAPGPESVRTRGKSTSEVTTKAKDLVAPASARPKPAAPKATTSSDETRAKTTTSSRTGSARPPAAGKSAPQKATSRQITAPESSASPDSPAAKPAASRRTSAATSTDHAATGPQAEAAATPDTPPSAADGARVFKRADLAKLISAPKKSEGAAGNLKAPATPPKPPAQPGAPPTDAAKKPASVPKAKKNNTNPGT
jgi:hypothetical protein